MLHTSSVVKYLDVVELKVAVNRSLGPDTSKYPCLHTILFNISPDLQNSVILAISMVSIRPELELESFGVHHKVEDGGYLICQEGHISLWNWNRWSVIRDVYHFLGSCKTDNWEYGILRKLRRFVSNIILWIKLYVMWDIGIMKSQIIYRRWSKFSGLSHLEVLLLALLTNRR